MTSFSLSEKTVVVSNINLYARNVLLSVKTDMSFYGLCSVARRISAKMETVGSTVGLKTKSLFQSLIDKTEQLKSKRNEYVEPADVAEKKVEWNILYAAISYC